MLETFTSLDRIRFGPGGGVYRIVATAAETQNRHFVFEAIEPPGGGPPLHTHAGEEEFFHVLEGEITFWIGGQVVTVNEGGCAFVPRGVPHCFKNCSTEQARLLVMFTPGTIEGFFEFGESTSWQAPPEALLVQRLGVLAPRYGLEILGPSPL